MPTKQNGRRFTDNILRYIFTNKIVEFDQHWLYNGLAPNNDINIFVQDIGGGANLSMEVPWAKDMTLCMQGTE